MMIIGARTYFRGGNFTTSTVCALQGHVIADRSTLGNKVWSRRSYTDRLNFLLNGSEKYFAVIQPSSPDEPIIAACQSGARFGLEPNA